MINKLNNNNKKYIQIDHLSDIGIEAYGSSSEELFDNAALGMFSIMCDLTNIKQIKRKKIFIKAEEIMELDDLLLLWLEKLLYVYEVEKMLFSKFDVSQIENKNNYKSINAVIYGEKIDLNRHELRTAIKAPTYHKLYLKKDENTGIWIARVIFDV
jgi:SHS2 domain-containing protein